jgi:hypothetical protein
MERGQRFSTTYLINEIINHLVANLKATGTFPDKKRYRLHLDNVRLHNSQASVNYIDRHKLVTVSHPPYSQDLVPSNFYLFGYRKGRLAKSHGTTKEKLFRNVTEILDSISEEEFVRVFLDWMRRLEQVEKISKYQSFTFGFIRFLHRLRGDYKDL